jgi:hypothetical protein
MLGKMRGFAPHFLFTVIHPPASALYTIALRPVP